MKQMQRDAPAISYARSAADAVRVRGDRSGRCDVGGTTGADEPPLYHNRSEERDPLSVSERIHHGLVFVLNKHLFHFTGALKSDLR